MARRVRRASRLDLGAWECIACILLAGVTGCVIGWLVGRNSGGEEGTESTAPSRVERSTTATPAESTGNASTQAAQRADTGHSTASARATGALPYCSPSRLVAQYRELHSENAVAAQERFEGVRVRVQGYVVDVGVSEWIMGPTEYIVDMASASAASGWGDALTCRFDASHKSAVQQLRNSQRCRIEGVIEVDAQWGGIWLDDCRFVP